MRTYARILDNFLIHEIHETKKSEPLSIYEVVRIFLFGEELQAKSEHLNVLDLAEVKL